MVVSMPGIEREAKSADIWMITPVSFGPIWSLYQASFKTDYLEKAIVRAVDMINLFGDEFGTAGFFSIWK